MQIATEDLISYLKIEYRNIKIEIERNCDLDSQWQIIYRNPDRSLELISKFPFSIRDYKFFRNGLEEIVTVETLRKGLPNPEISRNTNDARRIALQQYFQLIIADIRSESYSNEHPSELAEIRDAMVTQCIADFIQFKRRTD
jgi:hypothetical protein